MIKKLLCGLAIAACLAGNIRAEWCTTFDDAQFTDAETGVEYLILYDDDDQVWGLYDDLQPNTRYLVVFNNNGTPDYVYDDEIIIAIPEPNIEMEVEE